jgi:peptidoglycan hydrolase CwlO-like protein
MKVGRPVIVASSVVLVVILALTASLALSLQGRADMVSRHESELADVTRARDARDADIDELRAELQSAQAQIVALRSTLEEIRAQLTELGPDVSSRSAPSPMSPRFLRRSDGANGGGQDR